jgi:glycosyltransferase involved in cell wall biosynthesis
MAEEEVRERPGPPALNARVRVRSPEGAIISASGKTWARLYAPLGYELLDADRPVRMRVVAVVHKYPPVHNAGAEWMLHAILRRLAAAGDHVLAICGSGPPGVWALEGVNVVSPANLDRIPGFVRRADLVLTHLDLTRQAVAASERHGVPLVHLVHNDEQLAFHRVRPRNAALVVYNSRWIEQSSRFRSRRLVVRPPVALADYATTPGSAVTLVNVTQAKGAQTFYAAARALPALPFLGVRGAYGLQIARNDAPNVRIVPNTPDMRDDVYARTRVLLMPSSYESFGRVGIEAAASGIPTIAHPTAGLLESLGDAGLFVDRDDHGGYVRAIRDLEDPTVYAAAGRAARARAEELERQSEEELEELERVLLEIGGRR